MATPKKPKAAGVKSGKGKVKAASNGTMEKPALAKSPATNGNGAIFSADMIRVRAYEVFLERGSSVGDELSDWLTAEREIMEPLAPRAGRRTM
jgi:hypothetical protein